MKYQKIESSRGNKCDEMLKNIFSRQVMERNSRTEHSCVTNVFITTMDVSFMPSPVKTNNPRL